jgi:AcrR family transcriptional regulator
MNEEYNSLLERVSCMYHKYGIRSVTMDDVSRELGISKKTLYQYFIDKNDLVSKIIDLEVTQRNKQFQQIFNNNLNAIEELLEVSKMVNLMLKEYSPAIDYDLKKYYPHVHEKIHLVKSRRMYEMVLQNMKKGKMEGIFREEMNEEVIAKLHVSRIIASTDNSLFSADEFFSSTVFFEVFIYHIRGIANEKGLKILEQNLELLEKTTH